MSYFKLLNILVSISLIVQNAFLAFILPASVNVNSAQLPNNLLFPRNDVPDLLPISTKISPNSELLIRGVDLPTESHATKNPAEKFPPKAEEKPSNWRIFTPWRTKVDISKGCSYNDSRGKCNHTKSVNQFYAFDFNLDPQGGDIYPIAPGDVIFANSWGTFGNTVVLRHDDVDTTNNYYSLYAHLQEIKVANGESKIFDKVLGIEGNSGCAIDGCTPHLHLALWRCPKSYDIFEGQSQPKKLTSSDSLCASVRPEPMVGENIYESFTAWEKLANLYNYKTKDREAIGFRPDNYESDVNVPTGGWGDGASSGDIQPGENINFNVRYSDPEWQVKEVRLTIYYEDWAEEKYKDENAYPDLFQKWPIVARCDPTKGLCGVGAWNYSWDPSNLFNKQRFPDLTPPYLSVPWMPFPKPFDPKKPIYACISFDIFDRFGNSYYAPGGVRCQIPLNMVSKGKDINDPEVAAITAENEVRLIRILPKSTNGDNLYNASFISDLTLPDGSIVSSGQSLAKTWRVQNTGTSTWGNGYQLVFLRGDRMGAPASINVPSTAPGQNVDLSVSITAPSSPGNYTGYWQLRNSQGTYFAPEIWVKITVPGNIVPPPSSYSWGLSCTNCPAAVSPGTTFTPVLRVMVGSGQLLQSRGDMLRNTDNNLFGAHPHVAVTGTVNAGQSYDFAFYVANPITAPSSPGIYTSKWRIWQNGQFVGPEYALTYQVQSGAGTNRPPKAPTLSGPGDWAVYTGNTGINLSASQNGDPDEDTITSYFFEIFDSAQNANSGWISSNTWSPQGLGYNSYKWHSKVRDNRGAESDWSQQTWHFTVQTNEPQIYSFSSTACRPAWDDGNEATDKICFCASTNAGTLKLMVNSATDGSANGQWQTLNELGTSNYSCNTDSDRPPKWEQTEFEAGTHLVRLYARRDGGWTAAAHKDIKINLSTNRRPNGPFIKTYWYDSTGAYPVGGIFVNTKSILLNWSNTLRTTSYRVQASDNPSYTGATLLDVSVPNTTSEYPFTFASDYETVYWKVTAIGSYGQTTSTTNFHIDITPPLSSVTMLPAVSVDNKFTVNWSGTDERSGLRWYDVQVRDGNRPDSQWTDWQTNTTKTVDIFQGLPGHTYYFRVRAMDQVGNWEEWPDGAGDTFSKVDPTAAPQTSWWNNNFTYRRNVVVLNNDSDVMPVHFPVRLHFDGSTTPTSTEIYNASSTSTKGNDVRIVLNNTTELNRFVERFGPDQIDIWFPLQESLIGGGTNSTSYQLYYGNGSVSNPPADIKEIFLPQVDSNAVGFWRFQEGAGNTVNDSSGRGHNGVFYNPGWAVGLFGRTGSFNGSNAYVHIPHSAELNLGAMTLEAWIYLNGSAGDHPMIISKDYYRLKLNGDRNLLFGINAVGGNRSITSNIKLNMYQWYHVAGTYDGNGHMKVFVNGVESGSLNENPLNILYTSVPLLIGRRSTANSDGTSYFPGYIQNVRLSNIARTDFQYARVDILAMTAVGIQQTIPVQGTPDLVVQSLTVYPNQGGGILVEVVVMNQGSISTTNGFYTDLYINHLPTGTGDYTGGLQFWVNDSIPAGSTTTLTTVITDLSQIGLAASVPGEEKRGTLYVQTDSTGALTEADKSNNITPGTEICVVSPDAFEGDDTFEFSYPLGEESQQHNFDRQNDDDWVYWVAQQGHSYKIQTSGLGPDADTYLYLYAPDGITLLESNDDYGGSLESQLEWTAPADGVYFIRIKQWNPSLGGCGTSYTIGMSVDQPVIENTFIYLPFVVP